MKFLRFTKRGLLKFLRVKLSEIQLMDDELTPTLNYAARVMPQRTDETYDDLLTAAMELWKMKDKIIRTILRVEDSLESVLAAAKWSNCIDPFLKDSRTAISHLRKRPFWEQAQL